ncbi:MAG TPA: response regulator transcription factor [Actinomycetota bacterium]|nr:response regulator transcription factor [Actinomycetota bacterium]
MIRSFRLREGHAGRAAAGSSPIRVLIADDHPLVRRIFRNHLNSCPDVFVVGEASSGSEITDLVDRLSVNAVLLDVQIPGSDALATIRTLIERDPSIVVVMLSAYDDPVFVSEAIASGARGYLLKSRSAGDLGSSLRLAVDGYTVIDDELITRLVGRPRETGTAHPLARSISST